MTTFYQLLQILFLLLITSLSFIPIIAQTTVTYSFGTAAQVSSGCGSNAWDQLSVSDSRIDRTGGTSQCLHLTNVSISSGTNPTCNASVLGVRFLYTQRLDDPVVSDVTFQLIDASGTPGGTNQAAGGNWASGENAIVKGATNDTWGLSLARDDINDSDFGIRIALSDDGDGRGRILNPSIEITYAACASCTITITQSDETMCMDNSTNSNTVDDFFQIIFNATTTGAGTQYEVVNGANADGTGGTVLNTGGTNFGTAITIGTNSNPPFTADGIATYDITLRVEGDETCHADYTSSTVPSCSPCSATPGAGTVTLNKKL